MKVRTVSTLPRIDVVSSPDLLEISQCKSESAISPIYASTAIRIDDFSSQLKEDTTADIADKFDLYDGTSPISVQKVKSNVDSVISADFSFSGIKKFATHPHILSKTGDVSQLTDVAVPNVGNVKLLLKEYGNTISKASSVKQNPLNTTDPEGRTFNGSRYTETDQDNPFYYWHIDHQQKDSSYFNDPTGNNVVKVTQSGFLNIYGWLADDGSTLAQESWVGLFTKLVNETTETVQWVPISIVPWIQGTKSAIMQYVAFNMIPIFSGSELKIMTGFAVNGNNSGLGSGDSLLFKEYGFMANTFMGYIIEKE